jgi:SAM-dependent methyltransferase
MLRPEGHPVVAAGLDLAMAGFAHLRPRVVGAARGRVLEVGAGTGSNFALYSPEVTEVVAIEPDPHMRRRAEARLGGARVPLSLLPYGAEALPFADGSFDDAVLTWVLCTIPDVEAACAEVFRVLRPGGRALFIEHVGASSAWMRGAQRAVEPAWKRLAGGCHLTRAPDALLRDAGFEVEVLRALGGACSPVPLLHGVGHKRAAGSEPVAHRRSDESPAARSEAVGRRREADDSPS